MNKTRSTKIMKIPHTVQDTIIAQIISQNFCQTGLKSAELELLEYALVITFQKIVREDFLTIFHFSRGSCQKYSLRLGNVVVDTTPIYLKKRYLFENKIYHLYKIYFYFTKNQIPGQLRVYRLYAMQHKNASCLGRSINKSGSFLSVKFQFPKPWLLVTYSTSTSVPIQCLQTAKSLISSCTRTDETIFQQLLVRPSCNCCYSLHLEAATGVVL